MKNKILKAKELAGEITELQRTEISIEKEILKEFFSKNGWEIFLIQHGLWDRINLCDESIFLNLKIGMYGIEWGVVEKSKLYIWIENKEDYTIYETDFFNIDDLIEFICD